MRNHMNSTLIQRIDINCMIIQTLVKPKCFGASFNVYVVFKGQIYVKYVDTYLLILEVNITKTLDLSMKIKETPFWTFLVCIY